MTKRRPSGDGMVRKRDDGRWEGRIVIGHKKNGDPIFHHDYANSQKALTEKLHRSQEQYQDVELTEDSRMTLGEWLDKWLEEYKADIRAKLEAQAAERDNNNFTNAVIEKVLENATVEIPEAMIERQIDSMMRDFEYRLMGNGLKLDDFLKYTGSDMKAFRENYRGQAEKSVKAHLVLEAIEKAEAIDATQEQIDKQLEAFAAQTGKTVE